VDANLFTVHSSCTEEPVFVTFLYTLLQLPFLELSPLCASLKIAGSAIFKCECSRDCIVLHWDTFKEYYIYE